MLEVPFPAIERITNCCMNMLPNDPPANASPKAFPLMFPSNHEFIKSGTPIEDIIAAPVLTIAATA